MYTKTKVGSQKFFNSSCIELIRKIKIICKEIPKLTLSLENKYKIIEMDASEH